MLGGRCLRFVSQDGLLAWFPVGVSDQKYEKWVQNVRLSHIHGPVLAAAVLVLGPRSDTSNSQADLWTYSSGLHRLCLDLGRALISGHLRRIIMQLSA